jgi:hypothetical protein
VSAITKPLLPFITPNLFNPFHRVFDFGILHLNRADFFHEAVERLAPMFFRVLLAGGTASISRSTDDATRSISCRRSLGANLSASASASSSNVGVFIS